VEEERGRGGCDGGGQGRGRAGALEALDVVPAGGQSSRDGVDGFGGVELGFFLAVGEAEIVREGDFHCSSSKLPELAGTSRRVNDLSRLSRARRAFRIESRRSSARARPSSG